jgi:hypothetical protein
MSVKLPVKISPKKCHIWVLCHSHAKVYVHKKFNKQLNMKESEDVLPADIQLTTVCFCLLF